MHIRTRQSEQKAVSESSLNVKSVSNLESYAEPETINVVRLGKR